MATHKEKLAKDLKATLQFMQSMGVNTVPKGVLISKETLADVQKDLGDCKRCKLCKTRKNIVFGVGNPKAEVMFVGEGPGADEDEQGEPFVGRAGQLLTKIIEAMGLTRKEVYIANIVKCLRYNAMIQLGNGTWERIGRLVRQKYNGTVMSIDKNGHIVPKVVTGWHETPLANRDVYRMTYKSGRNTGASKSAIQLTGDHPVLTQRGYIEAQHLTDTDRVATGQGFSKTVYNLIIGSMLGDSHINATQAHLSFSHSLKQEAYAQFKISLLEKELSCNVKKMMVAAGGDQLYPIVKCFTHSHRALKTIRSNFYGYGNDKKSVPAYLKTELNPMILAFWFLDDGYMRIRNDGRQPSAEIATCAFSAADLEILTEGLNNLGLNPYIRRNRIFFDVVESRKLSELIAPYVPSSMRYKLHPEIALRIPFDGSLFTTSEATTLYDYIEIEKLDFKGTDKTFFCIDVEDTHNFVTAGGVVHNCRPPENRVPEPDEVATCKPFLMRQIAAVSPKIVVCLGATAVKNLLGRDDIQITKMRGTWIDWNGLKLMPTLHPAYLLRNPPAKKDMWEDMQTVLKALGKSIPQKKN